MKLSVTLRVRFSKWRQALFWVELYSILFAYRLGLIGDGDIRYTVWGKGAVRRLLRGAQYEAVASK